jgi:DNA polymerase-3 subunit alpha
MGSVLLDDRTGRIEVTFFSDLYEQWRHLLIPDQIIQVTGTLSYDEFRDSWALRGDDARTFEQARAAMADHLRLVLDLSDPAAYEEGQARLDALTATLGDFRDGDLPIYLTYRRLGAVGELRLGDTWRVEPSDALLKRLRRLLGQEAVVVAYERMPGSAAAVEPRHLRLVVG